MRKLSNKNKLYILLFAFIVVAMIGLLIYAISLSSDKTKTVYEISTNSVVFDAETNLIDTTLGGEIAKDWSDKYYFNSYDDKQYELGKVPVVYEKATDEIHIFGNSYLISMTGNVTENKEKTTVSNLTTTSFYKLKDRLYLIVSNEIYDEDKSIFANKYLIVYIDVQGNASILNDTINLKTINPIILNFGEYKFDIANENLTVGNNVIDLKLINGSTNLYVPKSENPVTEEVDMTDFIQSYNKLVNDFSQYAQNAVVGGNNQVSNNTIVTNGSSSGSGSSQIIIINNSTNINKRVSLRGAIAYPTYIDVSYIVTDPEDKYQAVYLLVTGLIDGESTSEKIILDKYETSYRITGLDPKHEYTITLGYIEVVEENNVKNLVDKYEDVINIRTTRCDAYIKVTKISKGYVHFVFKMTENYAIESGKISLYADGEEVDNVYINYAEALSANGFVSKMQLVDSDLFILKLENAKYNGNYVSLDIESKFVFQFLE